MTTRWQHLRDRSKLLTLRILIACSIVIGSGILGGCGKPDAGTPVNLSDGKVLSAGLVKIFCAPGATTSEAIYAEVDSTKLPAFYQSVLAEWTHVTGQNAPHWDVNAECTAFAEMFHALAKAEYGTSQFYTATTATAPAIAFIWYVPAGSVTGHAIVEAMTEKGRVFIEPQPDAAGNYTYKTLTQAEVSSIWVNIY